MTKEIKEVSDLQPDSNNANAGTKRGRYMVETSLAETGAGRSIVVDRNGRVIAGNKTLEAWAERDGEIQVVKSNGNTLIVVQREDLDLDDPTGKARKLAYYDNRAGEVGLSWDVQVVLDDLQAGLDLTTMFFEDELKDFTGDREPEPERKKKAVADTEHWVTCPQCGEYFSFTNEDAD